MMLRPVGLWLFLALLCAWAPGAGATETGQAGKADDGEEYYFPCLCKEPPSYTKLDRQGSPLPDSATRWSLVRDNRTGLVWEVKTDDGSLRDRDNTFYWCDSDPVSSRSVTGECGRHRTTERYVRDLNRRQLGGLSTWRLPTVSELSAIRIRRIDRDGREVDYFPNTAPGKYWSSTTFKRDAREAWFVDFQFGTVMIDSKNRAFHVRAVADP